MRPLASRLKQKCIPPCPLEFFVCDEFEQATSWESLLIPAGWTIWKTRGDVIRWRRPGKTSGRQSADTGRHLSPEGDQLLCVYSPRAAPFYRNGPWTYYSKFAVFAVLQYGGDYEQAAAELKRRGFVTRSELVHS